MFDYIFKRGKHVEIVATSQAPKDQMCLITPSQIKSLHLHKHTKSILSHLDCCLHNIEQLQEK